MNKDERVADLLIAVDEWQPIDDIERSSKEQMMMFLQQAAQPFSREADLSHVTASAVVLSSAGVLLHKYKLTGEWYGPGGHVDGDETPHEAAIREVAEETGIAAWSPLPDGAPLLLRVDVHKTTIDHIHYDFRYLFLANPDEPNPMPGESPDVGWYEIEVALDMTDFSQAQAIRRALSLEVAIPR